MRKIAPNFFWIALALIAAISGFDSYMSVRGQHYLYEVELNPIARMFMYLDAGGVALLIGVKTFGTALAVLLCLVLHLKKYKYAWIVVSVVLAVQVFVMLSYVPLLVTASPGF